MKINEIPKLKGLSDQQAADVLGIKRTAYIKRKARKNEYYELKDGRFISSNKETIFIE